MVGLFVGVGVGLTVGLVVVGLRVGIGVVESLNIRLSPENIHIQV